MFTHRFRIQLKPDSIKELSRKIHNEITPPAQPQKGFFDGVIFRSAAAAETPVCSIFEVREN